MDLEGAFAALVAELGADAVLEGGEAWRYGRGDHDAGPRPRGAIRVSSLEQVVVAVRVAAAHHMPLYPISRGQNWGYGAACPPVGDQVVLDLGGMDRIVEVDDDLAFVVLEPGVTQGQLHAHLREAHPELFLDCTDAPAATSIVGNLLERGTGFSRQGNRAAAMCGLELVLADATVVRTGYGTGGASTPLAHLRRAPFGPDLEVLVPQSNLAIVTKAGMWLQRRPEAIDTFWIRATTDGQLIEVLRAIGREHHGGLSTVVHAGTWLGTARWVAFGGLYGDAPVVAHHRGRVEALAVAAGADVAFVTPGATDGARQLARAWANLAAPSAVLEELIGKFVRILDGEPIEDPLMASGHLAVDEDGERPMRHLTVALPCALRADDMTGVLEVVRETMRHHGVRGEQWCAMTDPRSVVLVQNLAYEAADADAQERVLACHDALVDWAVFTGHLPYRLSTRAMSIAHEHPSTQTEVLRRIKRALDPHGIIAPGRYIPAEEQQ